MVQKVKEEQEDLSYLDKKSALLTVTNDDVFDVSRKLSELGFNSHKKRLIPKNSVLVTCIGSDMGKTVLNSSDCFTKQLINSLIPNNSVIDYDFAYYLFKSNEAVF